MRCGGSSPTRLSSRSFMAANRRRDSAVWRRDVCRLLTSTCSSLRDSPGSAFRCRTPTSSNASLKRRPRQGQARTDWLRRPLSDSQMDYALEDVRHLHALWDRLERLLDARNRRSWLEEEEDRRLAAVERDLMGARWRRVAGAQKLSRRGLAVVRELSAWREREAAQRNHPRAWVLSDHLIVAIAESLPRSLADLRRLRGLDRVKDRYAATLLASVERALVLPEDELPSRGRPSRKEAQVRMLGLLLEAVLESHCAKEGIDTSLVGGRTTCATWCAGTSTASGEKQALP